MLPKIFEKRKRHYASSLLVPFLHQYTTIADAAMYANTGSSIDQPVTRSSQIALSTNPIKIIPAAIIRCNNTANKILKNF